MNMPYLTAPEREAELCSRVAYLEAQLVAIRGLCAEAPEGYAAPQAVAYALAYLREQVAVLDARRAFYEAEVAGLYAAQYPRDRLTP